MKIPSKFNVAGFTINVEICKSLPDNGYGTFTDALNLIKLAKTIEVDGKSVKLTEDQIVNTFWHEAIHAFQFYYDNKYDEGQAQVYANFLCEMDKTSVQ